MNRDKINVLLIDNKDSFTYNLVQLFEELNCQVRVLSEPKLILSEFHKYKRIVFSPGPGLPEDFPYMFEVLNRLSPDTHLLGICLGHQAIAQYYGAKLFRQKDVQHGQRKQVLNLCKSPTSVFYTMPSSFEAGLYHSWAVKKETVPDNLMISCISDDDIIMAIHHTYLPIEGIQFHPESFLTSLGTRLIKSWLQLK